MRRLSLPLVLAFLVAACGGSSVTPTPVSRASVATSFPETWAGPVTMSTHITGEVQELTIVAQGNIVWQRQEDDTDSDLVPLAGTARYTSSFGLLQVTYDLVGGGCSEQGFGSLPFHDEDASFLLNVNGIYDGDVNWRETPPFATIVTCGPASAVRPAAVVFLEGFVMNGIKVDGRIKGEWTKVEGDATYSATWDLTPQ